MQGRAADKDRFLNFVSQTKNATGLKSKSDLVQAGWDPGWNIDLKQNYVLELPPK